jgi:hypothetical protein
VCTVLLRLRSGGPWPVLLAAVRDEFVDRAWDWPAAHWDGRWSGVVGGRDRTAGGTWLAVDPERRAVAALLNGPTLGPPAQGQRPTRGTLALQALADGGPPADLAGYDRFHLLRATLTGAELWSWDGEEVDHRKLSEGDHIIVNLGLDAEEDPLVPHFLPLLQALPDPLLLPDSAPNEAWEPWSDLLAGDGLDPADPRALIVRVEHQGRAYGSTSAALVALSEDRVRYDLAASTADADAWVQIPTA